MTESIAKILNDKFNNKSIVYVIQAVPGTRDGAPKINIVGAQEFGEIKVLLDEDKQIMFSPAPMIRKMKRMLKDFSDDFITLLISFKFELFIKIFLFLIFLYSNKFCDLLAYHLLS